MCRYATLLLTVCCCSLQLFGVMNGILMEDPACSQRGLHLTTYRVIPMTPRYIYNIQISPPYQCLQVAYVVQSMSIMCTLRCIKPMQGWYDRVGPEHKATQGFCTVCPQRCREEKLCVSAYTMPVALRPSSTQRPLRHTTCIQSRVGKYIYTVCGSKLDM